jgi:polyisoprenoid-binding protein YceI
MRAFLSTKHAASLFLATFVFVGAASAQEHAIDKQSSVMTIRVSKAGLFSALGHDHEIAAPITGGSVNAPARQVELSVRAGGLKVRDADISEKDRAQVQATMLGPEVLDAQRYPTIVFRATGAQPTSSGGWLVRGNLTLHGRTRPVAVEVRENGGHYVGSSRFKQTDFDITPIKVAGGAIRVKDEVRIDFDIQLTR